jgi:hypothetical protein
LVGENVRSQENRLLQSFGTIKSSVGDTSASGAMLPRESHGNAAMGKTYARQAAQLHGSEQALRPLETLLLVLSLGSATPFGIIFALLASS